VIDLLFGLFEQRMGEPFWLVVWTFWLVFMNTASLVFVRHAEGRMVLAAWLASLATLALLYGEFGYTRILGLAQLIWWTPLVVWLFRRRASFGEAGFGGWARLLLLSNAAALVVSAADVVRYASGDRPA
jgi:hypothetical protein